MKDKFKKKKLIYLNVMHAILAIFCMGVIGLGVAVIELGTGNMNNATGSVIIASAFTNLLHTGYFWKKEAEWIMYGPKVKEVSSEKNS